MAGQPGFFDLDERYAALSAAGDPLERLAAVVDFALFRGELDAALTSQQRDHLREELTKLSQQLHRLAKD